MSSGRAALAGLGRERPADRPGLAQLLGPGDLLQVDEDVVRGDPPAVPGESGRPAPADTRSSVALHPPVGPGVDQAGLPNSGSSWASVVRALRTGPEPGGQPGVVDRDEPGLRALDLLDEDDVGLTQPDLGPGGGRVLHLDRDHRVAAHLAAGQRVAWLRGGPRRWRGSRGEAMPLGVLARVVGVGGRRAWTSEPLHAPTPPTRTTAVTTATTARARRARHSTHAGQNLGTTEVGSYVGRRQAAPGRPWHILNFFPEPHGHGALRPTPAYGSSGLGARLADRLDRPVLVRSRVRQGPAALHARDPWPAPRSAPAPAARRRSPRARRRSTSSSRTFTATPGPSGSGPDSTSGLSPSACPGRCGRRRSAPAPRPHR